MRVAAQILAVLPVSAWAIDVAGDQTGVWDAANNPYRLVGDVRVPPGGTLEVRPGVQVVSTGYYKITVDAGRLKATGTAVAPVLFTANDHTAGWRGLRLLSAANDSLLDHCTFEYARGQGAYPEVQGGAVIVRTCSPTVQNCTFQYNSSQNANYNGVGAGVLLETSDAVVQDNVFRNNVCDSGAGVCAMEYGTPVIRGNLFDSNSSRYAGGGVYLGARNSGIVEGNRFFRNSSGGFGGGAVNSWTSYIYYGTFSTIRNNLIAHNTAATGAGVYCRYDRALLTNNTIVFNNGQGVYAINYPAQAPIVTNCVVWGNSGAQIALEASTGSAIAVSYSDVQGGFVGPGNIALDPLFVRPAADNFRLGFRSPCVDAADNSALSGLLFDLDGAKRFVDDPKQQDTGLGTKPLADMGAYERQVLVTIRPRPH